MRKIGEYMEDKLLTQSMQHIRLAKISPLSFIAFGTLCPCDRVACLCLTIVFAMYQFYMSTLYTYESQLS